MQNVTLLTHPVHFATDLFLEHQRAISRNCLFYLCLWRVKVTHLRAEFIEKSGNGPVSRARGFFLNLDILNREPHWICPWVEGKHLWKTKLWTDLGKNDLWFCGQPVETTQRIDWTSNFERSFEYSSFFATIWPTVVLNHSWTLYPLKAL